ncbi:MAG: acyl-CoA dehydrogenase family protein [Rhodobacter sp.]|nr:acyl-CoA dehydrogenase family protein [Paracoccaceae bacterium]MCC0079415.1 acyl-CoA dehydrogenase family protein [Rhodobacter sp.]
MISDARRPLFSEEHIIFREQVRAFLEREAVPHHDRWEAEGQVDRAIWTAAGAQGMLCPTAPEAFGGVGGDPLFSVVVVEELARAGVSGLGFWVHSEMAVPYVVNFGSEAQKQRWLPGLISGALIAAVGMTEPDAGSDLRGMKTRARQLDDGRWTIKGQKVFISNGQMCDLLVLAAKTEVEGRDRISLFLVDAALEGFRRGRNLDKLGVHAQDTSELFFDDLVLPADALLGAIGEGFAYLRHGLVRERMMIAVSCVAKAERAMALTQEHVHQRKMFGTSLGAFQNTRFVLADCATDITVGREFIDSFLARYIAGELDEHNAAIAKLWATEMIGRVTDACLQMFGGWGYMTEYPIARMWAEARVERIAGGASEVMRDLIGAQL